MSSPHRFVVREKTFTPADGAGVRRRLPECFTLLASHAKAERAVADCARRLADFQRLTNPFQLGGPCLYYQTGLPGIVLHDYLLDHGITPPATSQSTNPNYVFWWKKQSRDFTPEQRAVVWAACDKLQPISVLEEDDRNAVCVVLDRVRRDADDTEYLAREGGGLISVHRTIREAKRRAAELHLDWLEDDDPERTLFSPATGLVIGDEIVSSASIQTVPFSGALTGSTAYVLVRQSYASTRGRYETSILSDNANLGSRVALAAFADETAAEQARQACLETARANVNPVSLVWPDGVSGSLSELMEEHDEGRLPNGLTAEEMGEILHKLPVTPPAPHPITAEWYDRLTMWSPECLDAVWSVFADFQLFEVLPLSLD